MHNDPRYLLRCAASRYWSKAEMAEVEAAVRNRPSTAAKVAQLATTAAIVRRLVKRGWTRRYTSRCNGRAASRYLKHDRLRVEVRLSDHELPQNGRENKSYHWVDCIVNPIGDVDVQIKYIEKLAYEAANSKKHARQQQLATA